jgi:hypothetical protein
MNVLIFFFTQFSNGSDAKSLLKINLKKNNSEYIIWQQLFRTFSNTLFNNSSIIIVKFDPQPLPNRFFVLVILDHLKS